MPTALAPEVLTDPIGVLVDLVVTREPSLDRATVTERLGLIGLGAGIVVGLGLAVLLANRELLRRRRTI